MRMTTHRHVQVHVTLDILECKARVWKRCAVNLSTINNGTGARYYSHKALRADVVIQKLKARLSQSL